MGEDVSLSDVLDAIEEQLERDGIDALSPFAGSRRDDHHPGRLARPRRHEIAAAINRLRSLRVF